VGDLGCEQEPEHDHGGAHVPGRRGSPSGRAKDGIAALDAAVDAAPGWARTAPRERSDLLRRTFDPGGHDQRKFHGVIRWHGPMVPNRAPIRTASSENQRRNSPP
jgi:hypothetical protein